MESMRALIWLTQLGLSVATPLFVFILGAAWIRQRLALGGWVIVVGIALGLIGAISAGIGFYRVNFQSGKQTKKKHLPAAFREHD